uniref:DUF6266 family protein n=1 Tax=Pedobacter schmidteae TaxID=2201271 RepID=UPI000EB15D7C|nr:DUF6266 family protein [Pedobacter schmidteae]
MGTYKKGVLGPFRGKVGTVIGAIWNGIHYMRSLPDVSADNPTQAQLNVRARFAMVNEFLKGLKPLIKVGYQQFNNGTTPMNAASAYHLKNAVTGTSMLNYAIDYQKVMFSVGNLRKPLDTATAATAPAQVDFSWQNNAPAGSTGGTDRASFLVYSPAKKEFVVLSDAAARSALTYVLQLPPEFSGDTVECWMAFTSVDGKEVSDSVYVAQQIII